MSLNIVKTKAIMMNYLTMELNLTSANLHSAPQMETRTQFKQGNMTNFKTIRKQ